MDFQQDFNDPERPTSGTLGETHQSPHIWSLVDALRGLDHTLRQNVEFGRSRPGHRSKRTPSTLSKDLQGLEDFRLRRREDLVRMHGSD